MGKMKRAQVQQVDEFSMQTIKRKSRDYSTAHFPIAANARTDEFYEQFWRIPGTESNNSGRLSHVSSQPEMIPRSRPLLSRDKRLPLDTRKEINFLRLIHLKIFLNEVHLTTCKEIEKQSLEIRR